MFRLTVKLLGKQMHVMLNILKPHYICILYIDIQTVTLKMDVKTKQHAGIKAEHL